MDSMSDRAIAEASLEAGSLERSSGRASADERALLAAASTSLGLRLPGHALDQLVTYLDLLDRWSSVYNLTSVQGREARRIQHVNDSLAILAALERRFESGTDRRVLDVGSGAGLPGTVIAIGWPDARVTCVDSVGKKAAFTRQTAATLGLPNLTALHARVEDLRGCEPYDVITARAFASLDETVRWTLPLLSRRGVWALAKGRSPDDELADIRHRSLSFHVEQLYVPDLDAERCLVWIEQTQASP